MGSGDAEDVYLPSWVGLVDVALEIAAQAAFPKATKCLAFALSRILSSPPA